MTQLEAAPPSRLRSAAALAGFAGAVAAAGALGARSSSARSPWYRTLAKPRWQPPSAAFGPIWTTLYALTALSGWRAWRTRRPGARRAVRRWWLQLGLNAAWSPLFFGHHRPRAALADAAALLAAVASYARAAGRVDRPAALLVLPYLAWSAFALALNADLVLRNPGRR